MSIPPLDGTKMMRDMENLAQRLGEISGKPPFIKSGLQWIAVSESLPAEGLFVLWVRDGYWPYVVGKRDANGVNWGGEFGAPVAEFHHWALLPDPPEVK